ncbi:MAG: hypothetical protein PWP53_4112, partial [Lacrimispora sp.]|nr:hypothetical protein [Lacrimispora sp.]
RELQDKMVHLEQQIEFLKKPVFHRRDKCRVSFFPDSARPGERDEYTFRKRT